MINKKALQGSAITIVLCIVCFLSGGCATTKKIEAPAVKTMTSPEGFYHKVQKGQTLWRISRIYGVDLENMLEVNRMSGTEKIEIGQLILIPKKKESVAQTCLLDDEFIWPVKGRVVSSFGQTVDKAVNRGINIEPYRPSASVVASKSGKVVFYDEDFLNLGKTIIIEHPDGFWTVYSRNSEVYVKVGDFVKKGSPIAKVGSAGRDNGDYLHYEIRKGHIAQNPGFYLSK